MIGQDKLQAIIDKVDIVDLVSEYVKLEKKGRNYFGLCPFHQEKSPSFSVSPTKKIAKCMGCGEGGNPIRFLSKVENIGFEAAAVKLAERVGIELNVSVKTAKAPEGNVYHDALKIAHQFYIHYLNNTVEGKQALTYLNERGLDESIIKTFEIGLAPHDSDKVSQILISQGISEQVILDAGLARKHQGQLKDLFTDRIMFPIHDASGFIVGFSGRIYKDSHENEPKYVNSPESLVFKKSQVLYHFHQAKRDMVKSKRVVLFEGFMDVIAAYRAGITDGVCSMGTALTREQAQLIKSVASHARICYDGDEAGIKAAKRAIEVLEEKGLHTEVVLLPEKMDPDDFIKAKGKDALAHYINAQSMDPLDFLYRMYKKSVNLSNMNDIETFKQQVFETLRKQKSETAIDLYLRQLASDIGVALSSIESDFKGKKQLTRSRVINEEPAQKQPQHKPKSIADNKFTLAEKELFAFMLKNRAWAVHINKKLDVEHVVNPLNYELRGALMEYYHIHETVDLSDFMDGLGLTLRAHFESILRQRKPIWDHPKFKYSEADMKTYIELLEKEYHRHSEILEFRVKKDAEPSDFIKADLCKKRDKIINKKR